MLMEGTTAVVTGGTRGLGRAIAERFLDEGASVVCAARNPYDIKEVADRHPGRLLYHETDVTDEDSVRDLVETTVAEFGGLDVLVNNAGVSRDGKITRLTLDEWNTTVTTNLTGVFLGTRAAAPVMAERGGGRIVNISSCVATRPAPGTSAYSASKAAVEMFTRSSAVELAPKGIVVNALAPGYIDEGMGRQVAANPKVWEVYRHRMLAGRLGRPDEVGSAAVFLAGAEGSYVNGHVLEVNGGLMWTS
ncbi:SDR family NAD(P)-dependent oxidoreductase [Nocardiopsis aegyptia]|uniref:SDR family NAD(P)-dependent oxidoreductase n=1 Tax=Nocardiopsis aegyptia TaxID=220378 RepID=UPI00366AEE07